MLEFWNTITDLADDSIPVTMIYTDLRKAFDSVPHDLLLTKLEAYGIKGKNLKLLRSYLANRKQRVVINDTASEYADVESGVPQGGVLSGILFSLYINDLPEVLKTCKVSLYADDAKLYAPVLNASDIKLIQDDIDALMKWCKIWRLSMSTEKCFFLHFKPIHSKNTIEPKFKMNDQDLERRSQAEDLGITVSDDLKFHKHIKKICNRANAEIDRISRSFKTRTPAFLRDLYQTYVRPHLEYCSNVWNPVYQGDIDRLERVQNKFTRLLKHSKVMTPHERNTYLGITSHEERRERGDLIGIFKNIDIPKLFQKIDCPSRRNHSRALQIRRCRTNLKSHSFTFRASHKWNELPETVVQAKNLNEFKSELDQYLAAKKT